MIALVLSGTGFFVVLLVGVFAGPDRLILPGFLGLLACWGLAVWMSERFYRREVREFRLRERDRQFDVDSFDSIQHLDWNVPIRDDRAA